LPVSSSIVQSARNSGCAIAALIAFLSVGCGGDHAPPAPAADEIEYTAFPTTVLLSHADLAHVTSDADGTLSFSPAPASLASIDVGRVLVGAVSKATPAGLLRAVLSVDRKDDVLVLKTAQAPLQLAFAKLHGKLSRSVVNLGKNDWDAAPLDPLDLVDGNALVEKEVHFPIFDGDGDVTTTNDQVAVDGTVGGGFTYALSVDVDWGDITELPDVVGRCLASIGNLLGGDPPSCSIDDLLPEAKAHFTVNPQASAHLTLHGAASLEYEKDFDLATANLAPIVLGPLVFLPTVDVTARVEGSAGAGFSVGAKGGATFSTGATLSSKNPNNPAIDKLRLVDTDFSADDTQVTLTAHAKAGVGPRLNVELYGVAGPYAAARAYAEIQADESGDPCWSLDVGIECDLGIKITTPTLPVLGSITLIDWSGTSLDVASTKVASGECIPLPDSPPGVPGSGPDVKTFADPKFTPWVTVVDDTADDEAVTSPTSDGSAWSDVVRTIDGRYLSAGTRTNRAVKLDELGNVTWNHGYRTDSSSSEVRVLRTIPTAHASILALVDPASGESAAGLLDLGEAGGAIRRQSLSLPTKDCTLQPVTVVRDGADGFYVVGSCVGNDVIAIVHLDGAGAVVAGRLLGDGASERQVVAMTALPVGTDVVVLGTTSSGSEGTELFAARLSKTGDVVYSRRYLACDDPKEMSPTAAIPAPNGELTVVGSASGHREGFLMRLHEDGSVGFSSFTSIGTELTKVFVLNGVVELPTTGFLAVGSTVDLFADTGDPARTPSLALASLDSVGRPLWGKRYSLPDARASDFGAVALSDDGGAVVTGLAQHGATANGGLVAFKAFAKDGTLGKASGLDVSDVALTSLDCTASSTKWEVTVRDTAPSLSPVSTESTP
jgi:hypothetical protein